MACVTEGTNNQDNVNGVDVDIHIDRNNINDNETCELYNNTKEEDKDKTLTNDTINGDILETSMKYANESIIEVGDTEVQSFSTRMT